MHLNPLTSVNWRWPWRAPRAAPRCDGCEATLTASTGRMATPDGLGCLCVACFVEHTRPVAGIPAGRAA